MYRSQSGEARDSNASIAEERDIGLKYLPKTFEMVPYVIITIGGFLGWLAMFPLTMTGLAPLWVGFVYSTVFACACFILSHEAMHGNIGRPGTPMRFWNEVTGQVATIIIIFPFAMARLMHLEHHRHCNDPENDPDYADDGRNAFDALYKTWLNRQPGPTNSIHHYRRVVTRIGTVQAKFALRQTLLLRLFALSVMFVMCWTGYAFHAALLWWLPCHIGTSYIRFWLSWAPHHPRDGRGRYDNTVLFKSKAGHWLSMGMQYHLIHHLCPWIPNHRTKDAFEEMRPLLEKRGIDCSVLN